MKHHRISLAMALITGSIICLSSWSILAQGIGGNHTPNRTRSVLDDDGNVVQQRLLRAWFSPAVDQFGRRRSGYWQYVWDDVPVPEPSDVGVEKRGEASTISYRMPSWAKPRSGPAFVGAITLQDPNSTTTHTLANSAVARIKKFDSKAELKEVLKFGRQASYPTAKSFLVVRLKDNRVLDISLAYVPSKKQPTLAWQTLN